MREQLLQIPHEDQLHKIREEMKSLAEEVTRSTDVLMMSYTNEAEKYALEKMCKSSSIFSRWFKLC